MYLVLELPLAGYEYPTDSRGEQHENRAYTLVDALNPGKVFLGHQMGKIALNAGLWTPDPKDCMTDTASNSSTCLPKTHCRGI